VALEQDTGFIALGGERGNGGAFHEFTDELGHGETRAAHELLGHGLEGGVGLRDFGQLIRGGKGGSGRGCEAGGGG
jgi:hypothetical protein